MRRFLALALLAVVVAGCSYQDLGAPTTKGATREMLEPGESPSQRRLRLFGEALSAWETQYGGSVGDYLVGPNDELSIGILALESAGQTKALRRIVSLAGDIVLPWVGSVPVEGLTVRQVMERIRETYADGYINDPQVTVTIAKYGSSPVVVTGAVSNPGVYYLTGNRKTVLEILLQAGGPSRQAGSELLILRPGKSSGFLPPEAATSPEAAVDSVKTIVVDLRALVERGNLLYNVEVQRGDVLIVSPQTPRYFYVLGFVARPGTYPLRSRLDPIEAIAMAGGLQSVARSDHCVVMREAQDGQRVSVAVDLAAMAKGEQDPVYIQEGDTIIVGTSVLARLSPFLRPSAAASVTANASIAP